MGFFFNQIAHYISVNSVYIYKIAFVLRLWNHKKEILIQNHW